MTEIEFIEVEFMGGPLDGEILSVPSGPDPLRPQDEVVFVSPIEPIPEVFDRSEGVPVERYVYRTRPNPADDGPLWIAITEGPS